jgi:leucyl/phenylalanyl-tRNA---protein transferase
VSRINPEELLLAYRLGIFPMAESGAAEEVLWVRPHERGILPLEKFHVPRRLARLVRSNRYRVTVDKAFQEVIRGCAESRPERRETWINSAIVEVFEALHARGLAHSVEVWHQKELAGGLYGLELGAAFFAESKFSRLRDASKVALVHLAARLKRGGYLLLDAQFPNPHLEQFGAVSVTEERFQLLLSHALAGSANFYCLEDAEAPPDASAAAVPASGAAAALAGLEPAARPGDPGAAEEVLAGSSVLQVITHTS